MPTTRSESGRRQVATSTTTKRKVSSPAKSSIKKQRVTGATTQSPTAPLTESSDDAAAFVPARLSFSFDEGKQHLISADDRFQDLFGRLSSSSTTTTSTEKSALAVSILGQQISWHAARSIIHKFKRLYDPSLPESWKDCTSSWVATSFFPTPLQVTQTDLATLRMAGLSVRKAEYVKDLAERFADGGLSTEKLISADDEQLTEMLTAVRGIGKWTVDMFAIFSLRRPDILPVGDLGVQRGLVRWFLSLHSSTYTYSLSPQKIDQEKETRAVKSTDDEDDVLPVFAKADEKDTERGASPDISSVPPVGDEQNGGAEAGVPKMPPPFTPSIERTLRETRKTQDASSSPAKRAPPPLPAGLSAAVLKTRLDGKKKIKGAFLTPQEMEELTQSWRPYRSLGVYYMWSLADPPAQSKK